MAVAGSAPEIFSGFANEPVRLTELAHGGGCADYFQQRLGWQPATVVQR